MVHKDVRNLGTPSWKSDDTNTQISRAEPLVDCPAADSAVAKRDKIT